MIEAVAIILGIVGLIGCILPIIPGPPVSWAGLLVLFFWGKEPMTLKFLIIWLVITIIVTVLDYVVPAYFTRVTGGSKIAARGSLAGMLVGIVFFPPWGMIAGAFIGALLSEVIFNGQQLKNSVKPALGSFLGFICGTFLKLVASGVMLFYIFKYI
ncbi:MAG: DUF456 domain-containing protein [Bacteroidales bacterium]|nr:DUF456 domain-containing protein [Bacteroidales bacterium]MDD4670040.1 DUF456 domain-containing protein [Bacteroidales bacterium]